MAGNEMYNIAVKYVEEYGFSVFPVNPTSKRPAIKSWEKYQSEKPTREELKEWFEGKPGAGIAIVTGKASGVFVVDLDTYKPDYKEEIALQYFPDSLNTPTVKTQHGGRQLYFKYPDTNISIRAGLFPGIDYRGNGGYVVAPPTKNAMGNSYEWLVGLDQAELAGIPAPFIGAINNNNNNSFYKGQSQKNVNPVTSVTSCDIWRDGVRDENLYHVALSLAKTGNDKDYIMQTLMAIMSSWGENDEKWASSKVESAFDRKGRSERNLHKEVESFISVTSGYFSVTEVYQVLHVVTKEDKASVRAAINRLKDKVIEKYGQKDGVYKRIDHTIEFMDFDAVEEVEYPIKLPLGLSDVVEISAGNIILVAGEFNAGKSLFALVTVALNKNKMPIRFISSEAGPAELKKRFRGFTKLPPKYFYPDQMLEYVYKSQDFHDALKPGAINIIDYAEFAGGDFTQGAEMMRKIHDKLSGGVAVVAVQKKEGTRLPRSGDLILEKPRLAISLSKLTTEEDNKGTAEILKAKAVKLGKCDGKKMIYEINQWGSEFKVIRDWGYWR